MKPERRSSQRARAHIRAWWGAGGVLEHRCVIRDISARGCFVSAQEEAAAGQAVLVEVGVPGVAHMQARGKVVRSVAGQGFAVRFEGLTAAEQVVLSSLVRHLAEKK